MERKHKLTLFFTLLLCFNFFVKGYVHICDSKSGNPAEDRPHPLDPLTEDEIRSTSNIIKSYYHQDIQFNYIVLKEPPKSLLLQYFLNNLNPITTSIPRRSFAIVLNRAENQIYEFTVNLDKKQVERWRRAPAGLTSLLTAEEASAVEEIVRANSAIQERCAGLGYHNMSLVITDIWAVGYIEDKPEFEGRRLCQAFMYGQNFENDNYYAHPFDFLVVVDLLKGEVAAIEDLPTHDDFDASNKEGNTVPRKSSNYDPELRESSFRKDLKPVRVSQEGTSFTLKGNQIEWQKYKLRLGFNGREGLVLYLVNYKDGGKVRPLFYRMSVAEMFIPYGDPRPPYHRKQAFDEGEYGIGFCINSLKPNLDCIGETRFMDAVLHDENGVPQKVPNAVCIREEDAGILWRHFEDRSGKSYIVRSQRLAMTFVATVGNYDYLFTWNFYQDGSIEFNVMLSGVLSTSMLAVNATAHAHGSVVMPQVNSLYHQHFFSLRLDAEIDGNRNRVSVSDIVAGPGKTNSPTNPYGQGFTTERKVLRTAGESRTNVATDKSRTWLITNPDSENPNTKGDTGWKLIPYPSAPMLLLDDSPIHPKAAWMDYNTWVTPYKEDQFFPGGYYLNNSGLSEWVGADENANIVDTDVVIWHNFGISHIPRTEDFPVMPVESCSVFLKPYNFYLENPAMDIPPLARTTEL